MTASLTLRGGSLYLAYDVYDRYFAGLDAVILLCRDDDLLVLPVRHAAAGGYLLKQRNSVGDRVVHAAEFFRSHGIPDDAALALHAEWSTERGGLVAPLAAAKLVCTPLN